MLHTEGGGGRWWPVGPVVWVFLAKRPQRDASCATVPPSLCGTDAASWEQAWKAMERLREPQAYIPLLFNGQQQLALLGGSGWCIWEDRKGPHLGALAEHVRAPARPPRDDSDDAYSDSGGEGDDDDWVQALSLVDIGAVDGDGAPDDGDPQSDPDDGGSAPDDATHNHGDGHDNAIYDY